MPSKTKEFMCSLIEGSATARVQMAKMHLRTFTTKQDEDDDGLIAKFLPLCPNLFSIAFWQSTIPPPLRDLSIPSLRRVLLYTDGENNFSFSAPIFRSVTHLDVGGFDSDEWPILRSAGLRCMPSLTHLVIDGGQARRLAIVFDDILLNLPPSIRIVLMQVDDTPSGLEDPRILLFNNPEEHDPADLPCLDVFHSGFHAWTGKQCEEETFWTVGEKLLEEKRRNAK
ncbi:hypothetical protein DL96DRAFT_1613567 [Flagelloscypha sp. PMI_526]|nr:hypothetical protein DL96DRAFT_1613567 [Flagelloscypha sp. PMI_526]